MTNQQVAYGSPKERMLKNIATLWGTKNIDTLDPLVKILIEALSGELHKTHYVIYSFEKRMLERLALLMTPGVLAAPYCAHAVIQAFPNDPVESIESSEQFIYPKKMSNQQMQNIHFSPIDNVPVFDANIKHLVINNTCWMIDELQQKSNYINMLHRNSPTNAIWVGVKINPEINNLKGFSFYFDQNDSSSNHLIRQLLASSEWFIGDKKINMRSGRSYSDKKEIHSVFSKMDAMHLIEKEVKYLYDANFMHIADEEADLKTLSLEKYPEIFKQLFLEQHLTLFDENLLWIKICSDALIHNKNFLDINILINAFPVLNRKMVNYVHRFKNYTNSIPLRTSENEFFLSTFSVEDDFAKKYTEIPFAENNSWGNYTYTIRKGGMERMDARDAKEYLDYIVELMRDESRTFASYGQDAITNILKELDQLVSQLNQRVNKKTLSDADVCSYLFLADPKNDETYFIDYWVTNAIHANGIMSGAKLTHYKGSKLKKESLCFKTTSVGGKYALTPARHIDAYKYASLTHNKIVTAEDIKACCMHELGDKIERTVSVSKGLVLSNKPKQGLVRCVEVFLKKKKQSENEQENIDWNIELKNLQSKLELRSALNMTIKVHLS